LIQHYDEIITMLEALRQEKLFFRDEDGATFEYSIRRR
jgi:hypothetical protein